MNNHVVVGTDSTFEQTVLNSELPVLVDFWAPWCGPCRMVGPVVDELAVEYANRFKFVKLNTDENGETAGAYGIMSIPTLVVFKNGQPVDGLVGAAPKKMLKELIEKHVERISIH